VCIFILSLVMQGEFFFLCVGMWYFFILLSCDHNHLTVYVHIFYSTELLRVNSY